MNTQQVNNLIYFTMLFAPYNRKGTSPFPDSSFFNSHQTYIIEKWNALINVEPNKTAKLNKEQQKIKDSWITRWGAKNLDKKTNSVINYVCCLFQIKNFTFNDMLYFFKKHIGDYENISSEEYRHLHIIFVRYTKYFIEQNRRQINLHLLLQK